MNEKRSKPVEWPIFETMGQASANGIPLARMKFAKRGGCGAFRGTRVHAGELVAWLLSPDRESGSQSVEDSGMPGGWGEALKREQALATKTRRLKIARTLVDYAEFQQAVHAGGAIIFGTLERIFCNELPASLKGCDEREIRAKCIAAIDRLRAEALVAIAVKDAPKIKGEK